jgi:hypothetical protein
MRFLLAYGRPVRSSMGRASKSARRRTVVPGPLRRIAARPWRVGVEVFVQVLVFGEVGAVLAGDGGDG